MSLLLAGCALPSGESPALRVESPASDEWDLGSLTYLASYDAVAFWVATRRSGEQSCLILVGDYGPFKAGEACADTSLAEEKGLSMNVSEGSPQDGVKADYLAHAYLSGTAEWAIRIEVKHLRG